ncbi:MAG TPA: serine/threonine-protein kinase [Myxococcota bacterium]
MSASDPIVRARALLTSGDVDGAERVLATAALSHSDDPDRIARALLAICEHRGDVGLRAQQALDEFVARRAPGEDNELARLRVGELFRALGIVGASARAETQMPDLPDLDGFGAPASIDDAATLKTDRVRTLADVASELDVFAASPAPVPVPLPPRVEPVAPSPTPGLTPGSAPATPGDVQRAFGEGAVINERYEVRAQIGRGGHATVMRVFDRELSEECALKVFHNTGDAGDVARFKREVSISRKIVHENVVTLYDIGQAHGYYYLTMELLDGEDLAGALRHQQITMRQGLRWLIEACRGLQAAHDKGVVHRDVKPGNLFVQARGPLKVMDFGIAKPADALSLTSTGVFVGTPQYVSPEQVQGIEVTVAADIYSLGVVAYLLLTGTLPFRDKEMVALLMKHATQRPDPPRSRNPSLPAGLDALLLQCLEKKAADRPRSCAAVADALARLLG